MPRRRFGYGHFYDYEPTRPRTVEGGLEARSKRGAFATTWWSDRWVQALEAIMDRNRMRRGRTYARKGQVMAISESTDGVEAQVMGSRLPPYRVHIALAAFDDAAWARVLDLLCEEALFVAQLLGGELPHEIEQVFAAAGLGLFPDQPGDLATDCSCPDWANPCKHIAAVHYILAERFDEDPFLILRLRGRDHVQLLAGLRERRRAAIGSDDAAAGLGPDGDEDWDEDGDEDWQAGEEAEADRDPPLEACLDTFWQPATPLESLATPVPHAGADAPLLRRLGEAAFVTDTPLEQALGPALRAVATAALATAEGEREGEEGDEGAVEETVEETEEA
jgi:uncharacterized Zn finger protein